MGFKTAAEVEKELVDLRAKMLAGEETRAQQDQVIGDLRGEINRVKQETAERAQAQALEPLGGRFDAKQYQRKLTIEGKEKSAPLRQHNGINLLGGYDVTRQFRHGLLDAPRPQDEWHAELLRLVNTRGVLRMYGFQKTPELDGAILDHLKSGPAPIARAFADASGVGAEWMPDTLMPVMYETLRTMLVVAGLFPRLQAPSKDFILPYLDTGLLPQMAGAATGSDSPAQYTASSVATAQRVRAIVSLVVRTVVDDDAEMDSILAVAPLISQLVARALAGGIEDAVINGDSSATHQDTLTSWNPRSIWPSGYGGTGDHRRSWEGLRRRCKRIGATASGDYSASQTYAGVMEAYGKMGSNGSTNGQGSTGGASSVALISSIEWLVKKLLPLSEFATIEKFGALASVITGRIGKLANLDVFISDFMTADLNTAGIYDGTTTTKTGALLVNTSRFLMCDYQSMYADSQKDITRGITHHVAKVRTLFTTPAPTGEVNAFYLYNLG